MKYLPLLLLLALTNVYGEQCTSDINKPCEIVVVSALPSGKSFALRLVTETLNTQDSSGVKQTGFWGADGQIPETHVAQLSLSVESRDIDIPAKVYSDLGSVHSAETKENEHALVLIIKGGVDSSSYYAKFVISEGRLRKRTVRSQQNPNQIWEKTSFSAEQNVDAI